CTGPVKDGPRHHRCAATASNTQEPSVPKPPSSQMTTGRTNEAARPPQPFQAVCISPEPSPKLPKRLGVVGAGQRTFHCPRLVQLRLNGYPRAVLYQRPRPLTLFASTWRRLVLPIPSRKTVIGWGRWY